MINKIKTLVTLIGLLVGMASAFAATPFPFTLFTAATGGTSPVFSENYLTSSTSALLPSGTSIRAGHATMYDSTGTLTWAPNNGLLQTEAFGGSSWLKSPAGVTITTGQSDPFGGTNAAMITDDASTAEHFIYQSASNVNGTGNNVVESVYVKAGTINYAFLQTAGGGSQASIIVDLTTGAITQYSTTRLIVGSPTATSIGGGWWRISFAVDNPTWFEVGPSGSSTPSYAATGSGTIYVYGPQAKRVTYETTPSTFNPTTTAVYYGPRFEYGLGSTTKTGWLIEGEARTNVVLWNRDLTNAAWVKSVNMDNAKDQTGIDGVANSASRLKANGAGNQTCLQSITSASATRITSVFVKRITGTGNIDITQDATDTAGTGATWTTVTVTSSWTRVNLTGATVTNPIVGFRIVTDGDEIAVDFVQTETYTANSGAWYSSPIYTTTASVTRAAESVTGTTTLLGYTAATGTLIVEADSPNVSQQAYIAGFNSTGGSNAISTLKSNTTFTGTGTNIIGRENDGTETIVNPAVTVSGGSTFRSGVRWNTSGGATGFGISVNGGAITSGQVRTPTPTTFRLGVRNDGYPLMGHARMVYNYNTDLGNTEFQAKTTVGASP